MAQSPGADYRILRCECGSEHFNPTVRLKWKPGGGTVQEPGQFVCVQCRAQVDSAYLIGRAELQVKREELAAKAAELQQLEGERPTPRRPAGQPAGAA